MENLSGKKAVVTGGSRGIGRVICLAFAQAGADVLINYAGNQQAARKTAADCEAMGVKAIAVQADISTAEGCDTLMAAAAQHLGGVDILVNNAGVSRDALIMRATEEEYDEIMNTNLKSAFLCSKFVAHGMIKQRSGRIINMSSVVGVHGNSGQTMYAASKAGMIGLTKSLAKEVASRNITVNAVAPGFIKTDMTDALPDAIKTSIIQSIPATRWGRAEEVAQLVCYLAGENAAYITGQVISIDGGMGM